MTTAKPLAKPLKIRTWYVFHINCDCGSYEHARQRLPRSGTWIRCHHCNRRLGDMETFFRGTFRAALPWEAIEKADEEYQKRKQEEKAVAD